MSNPGQSRRKISNFVVDRGALIRLSVPFFVMIAVNLVTVCAMRWQVLIALQSTELFGLENLGAMNALLAIQDKVTLIGTAGSVILALLCFAMWIVFSHRIFGPVVPIRRHIHKLIEGDYSSRLVLRPADELKQVSEDLNTLAETLAAKQKS